MYSLKRAGRMSSPWRKSLYSVMVFTMTLLFAVASYSATQGQLGTSSTGSLTIRLTIHPKIEISSLDDINIDVYNQDQAVNYNEPICIRSTSRANYRILASGSGAGGRFILQGQSNNSTVPYDVSFENQIGQTADRLQAQQPSGSYTTPSLAAQCGGKDSSAIRIKMTQDNIKRLEQGTYQGSLTLTVAIE